MLRHPAKLSCQTDCEGRSLYQASQSATWTDLVIPQAADCQDSGRDERGMTPFLRY